MRASSRAGDHQVETMRESLLDAVGHGRRRRHPIRPRMQVLYCILSSNFVSPPTIGAELCPTSRNFHSQIEPSNHPCKSSLALFQDVPPHPPPVSVATMAHLVDHGPGMQPKWFLTHCRTISSSLPGSSGAHVRLCSINTCHPASLYPSCFLTLQPSQAHISSHLSSLISLKPCLL